MVSSFGISIFWLILKRYGPTDLHLTTHEQLLYTVAFTTVCWVATALVRGLETDRKTLVVFLLSGLALIRVINRLWAK